MRLSFIKVSFAIQLIISEVYPNVWKLFRFKISTTYIPYIFITDPQNSVQATGNPYTKKFLETFNPQPWKTWNMGRALWGL